MTRSCPGCAATLETGALFCGQCGRVAGGTASSRAAAVSPGAPGEREPLVEPPVAERVTAPTADRPPRLAVVDAPARTGGSSGATPDPAPVPAPREPLLPVPAVLARQEAAPGRRDELIDLESTVLSGSTDPAFVLQFSTGESVRVRGEGLIGRSPTREPGEVVDQVIPLADAGRSVSKTHVQFGQDRGRFWISDRFSTNGTVVRPPGEPPRRCEPGRRYLVSRGSRVDIGDQFFVVS